MSSDYSIEYNGDIAVMRLHATVDLPRMLEILQEIAAQLTAKKRLWIGSHHFIFTAREIEKIAKLGKELWTTDARVAYLASDRLSYNLLKVLEVDRRNSNYVIKVFRDEREATAWLNALDQ